MYTKYTMFYYLNLKKPTHNYYDDEYYEHYEDYNNYFTRKPKNINTTSKIKNKIINQYLKIKKFIKRKILKK